MAMIILRLWSPSPKYHHDLHCYRHDTMISIILIFYECVVTRLSRQLLLLQLLLSHSDKVKQLFGACILCNNETTIRLQPVADNFNKTWSSYTTIYISACLDHITSQHALQNKLDVLYFVVASFTWLLRAEQEPFSPTIKTTMIVCQVGVVLTFARTGRSHTRFN